VTSIDSLRLVPDGRVILELKFNFEGVHPDNLGRLFESVDQKLNKSFLGVQCSACESMATTIQREEIDSTVIYRVFYECPHESGAGCETMRESLKAALKTDSAAE
jgi:hypothetical protein